MPAEHAWEAERTRLERAYARRDAAGVDAVTWSGMRPEAHWLEFSLQRFLFSSLARQGWIPQTAAHCRLLEVGCGTGRVLRWFYEAGFRLLWGCEVLRWRVEGAARTTPVAAIMQAEMGSLPFPDDSFDCVVQVVAFSSCLDEGLRRQAAREMLRVVRAQGCILWCDVKPRKGEAEYLHGLGRRDLLRLFPGASIQMTCFGVDPQLLGAFTSLLNQGLFRSLARWVPRLRDSALVGRRPISKFPQVAAAVLERCPWATAYLGAVIRKSSSRS